MRNAVALLFLFVCCCFCFFNITFFLNLDHHFLIFDEFLIKLSLERSLFQNFQPFFEEGLAVDTLSKWSNTHLPNMNNKPRHYYDVIILLKAKLLRVKTF